MVKCKIRSLNRKSNTFKIRLVFISVGQNPNHHKCWHRQRFVEFDSESFVDSTRIVRNHMVNDKLAIGVTDDESYIDIYLECVTYIVHRNRVRGVKVGTHHFNVSFKIRFNFRFTKRNQGIIIMARAGRFPAKKPLKHFQN